MVLTCHGVIITGLVALASSILTAMFLSRYAPLSEQLCPAKTSQADCNRRAKIIKSQQKPTLSREAGVLQKCVRRGTFAFLVQAEGGPSRIWIDISRLKKTTVLWLSWKRKTQARSLPMHFQDVTFLPNSTFSVGRNALFRMSEGREKKQGWCYEYLIFCDEDVTSIMIVPESLSEFERVHRLSPNESAQLSMPLKTMMFLEYLLLKFRPARAGVHLQSQTRLPKLGTCDGCCFQDPAVEAIHRTATRHLLPYTTFFDNISIWMSNVITDISANVLVSPYCAQFNEILVLEYQQKHAPYPKKLSNIYEMYPQGVDFVRESHHSEEIRRRALNIGEPSFYVPRCFSHPCIRMPRNVNYIDLLKRALKDNS